MPHMVIFRDAEGRPGYHQAEGIDDAVRFVEQLRNEQDVTETRIFSMQEVPIEFRTYYRVALAPPPAPAVEAEMAPPGDPSSEPEAAAEADADPHASGESEPEVAAVGAMSDSAGGNSGIGGNGGSTRFGRFRG